MTDTACGKLPDLISDYDSLEGLLKIAYNIYLHDLTNGDLSFRGKPIKIFNDLNHNLQHVSFEHLTTAGNYDRLFNEERIKRIRWVRTILSGLCLECSEFLRFQDVDWKATGANRDRKRFIIWCKKEKYVIILEERQREVFLITAYCLLYESKLAELKTKLRKYKAIQKR